MTVMHHKWIFRWIASLSILILLWLLAGLLMLPRPLFNDPYATVIYSNNNRLLGARIALDGQWRFPAGDTIPAKFKQAVLLFEDRHFYEHPGFNPVSIYHALVANLKAGKVVRGGSTVTQQVIRLSRKGKSRTLPEKITEVTQAVALELNASKEEILQYFTDHAPMGGNIVGVEAAAWRYFGHPATSLSWAEAATLAVLPNAPSLINPGKNRPLLLAKRNRLLDALQHEGILDSLTAIASKLEPLPDKPYPLPNVAPHLVDYCLNHFRGQRMTTHIDLRLQEQVNRLVEEHHKQLSGNNTHNAAVLVVSVPDNQVVAYVGNTAESEDGNHQNSVDVIRAKRSTGSILKPLLYAGMQEAGMLLPNTLVADIPSYYNNYHPTNFDDHYSGSVAASEALSRSLNVPAIFMLRDFGEGNFLRLLKITGITSFDKSADHYGLSMILGGGEASLWELTGMYAGMARTVLDYDHLYGKYTGNEYDEPILFVEEAAPVQREPLTEEVPLHAASIWLTYQSLKQVNRPGSEAGWEQFASSQNIAWKTGTSFGFRDAWAIGTTADYVVGVWVGNADGEGRTGLTGTASASPIMFEVFQQLETTNKFYPPYDELVSISVCRQSGHRAGLYCPDTDTIQIYEKGLESSVCPYHQRIFTDSLHAVRLSLVCATIGEMVPYDCFVLPPIQEWYYKKGHPLYHGLPPWKPGCSPESETDLMKFIYPIPGASILLPRDGDGTQQQLVLQISHREPESEVFWHLDNEFVGVTKSIHQLSVVPKPGNHTMTVVDASGATALVNFSISER